MAYVREMRCLISNLCWEELKRCTACGDKQRLYLFNRNTSKCKECVKRDRSSSCCISSEEVRPLKKRKQLPTIKKEEEHQEEISQELETVKSEDVPPLDSRRGGDIVLFMTPYFKERYEEDDGFRFVCKLNIEEEEEGGKDATLPFNEWLTSKGYICEEEEVTTTIINDILNDYKRMMISLYNSSISAIVID